MRARHVFCAGQARVLCAPDTCVQDWCAQTRSQARGLCAPDTYSVRPKLAYCVSAKHVTCAPNTRSACPIHLLCGSQNTFPVRPRHVLRAPQTCVLCLPCRCSARYKRVAGVSHTRVRCVPDTTHVVRASATNLTALACRGASRGCVGTALDCVATTSEHVGIGKTTHGILYSPDANKCPRQANPSPNHSAMKLSPPTPLSCQPYLMLHITLHLSHQLI